ncbi:MAG: hypothetical protein KJT01_02235 [Gemmatimonadetes bacterium]|nr:hypothetical protein [Gemmatimonadota bacterium]
MPTAAATRPLPRPVHHRSCAVPVPRTGAFTRAVPAALGCVLALAVHGIPAGAQQLRPTATGATVAVSGRGGLVSTNVDGESRWSRATGVGGEVGFGVNPRLAVLVALSSLRLDSDPAQRFRDADIGFRRLFGRGGGTVRPFLEGGIAVQRMTVGVPGGGGATAEVRATTGSVSGGGGAMWFLRRQLAVEGAVRATGGRFSSWTDAQGVNRPVVPVQARSVTLRVGARYWLAGR